MEWLCDASVFIPRDHCGKWSDILIAVNQTANFLIFLAYFSIPLSLMTLRHKIKNDRVLSKVVLEQSWIVVLFIIFILFCGLTHLMDVLAFSWAPYRLFTFFDVVTAAASIPTALLLPRVVDKIITEAKDDDVERP